ncbi:MAG: hypothetical protein AAF696_23225 [Bacteroidota bacterium]
MDKGNVTRIMVYQTQKAFYYIATILLLLSGCSDITPIWKGDHKLQNFTLYTNEPCQYKVSIGPEYEQILAKLELTITYYNKISRNDLPLSIFLEQDSSKEVQEFTVNIPLKEEGDWLGTPIEGKEYDLILSYDAVSAIKLGTGSYTLRIFADDLEVPNGEIEGVMQVDARLYALLDGDS